MYTAIEVKKHASRLGQVLNELNHELKHSHCLEIISKLEGFPDWNTHTAELNKNQQIAEQFLDEILAAEAELNFVKFTQRFEPKYITNFTESEFLREMQDIREDYGTYIRREFLGCLAGEERPDGRYPNRVRYVWRGFFDKNEVLITAGVYHKNGVYYLAGVFYQ